TLYAPLPDSKTVVRSMPAVSAPRAPPAPSANVHPITTAIASTIALMPMDLPKLRKLVALDESDPLSRFALGKKLFEESAGDATMLDEAARHLKFANAHSPDHLATYHILGQVLIQLGRKDEARTLLETGVSRVSAVGEGMGRDLGPAMQELLRQL